MRLGTLPIINSLAMLIFVSAAAFGQSFQPAGLKCLINQLSARHRSLRIECLIANPPYGKTSLQFVDQFAGVNRLSERIRSLKIYDKQGVSLPLEIRGNGVFSFENSMPGTDISFSYEMHLARALDPSQYALVSSIGSDAAVLMLSDLLPGLCAVERQCTQSGNAVDLKIDAPENWQIATSEDSEGDSFRISDLSRAIFFIGKLRTKTVRIGAINLSVGIAGEINFSDEEIFLLAEAIAREQALMIGGRENGTFMLAIAPYPLPLTGLRSSAVTIGRTAVLLFNPNNNAQQSLKHFRRHLAHEMFHFYLPNAFNIRENFDWFWEGFTRYIALLTLARLGMVDLNEYLEAVSAEYETYLYNPARQQFSLIEASPEKFSSSASYDLVYHKGMFVAALYDLELRWQSSGQSSVLDVVKKLYGDFAGNDIKVGNKEVLEFLEKQGSFSITIKNDIRGIDEISLAKRVKHYGLIVEQSALTGGRLRLKAGGKLNSRQRKFLDALTAR